MTVFFFCLVDYSPNKCVLGFATNTLIYNKARYTATLVVCGWAGAMLEKVTRASGKEPYAKQVAQGQYVVSNTRCPALSDCELW